MTGIHNIEITYEDGRVERPECPCQWCEVWRAVEPQIYGFLRAHEPPVWAEWLGPEPEDAQ